MTTHNRFDDAARDWDKRPEINKIADVFLNNIRRHVRLASTTNALEFGCGTGIVGLTLASNIKSITLLDSSQGMQDVLKEKIAHNGISNAHPIHADVANAELPHTPYDLAYSLMALHHVTDVPALLTRLHNHMAPQATLCIGDLYPEDGSFHGDNNHDVHFGFDTDDLTHTLADHGFTVQTVATMHTITKDDTNSTPRKYPLFFLAAKRS